MELGAEIQLPACGPDSGLAMHQIGTSPPKKPSENGLFLLNARLLIIRMCCLQIKRGKDKAKHLLQNPSLFVTFRHKKSKNQHKNRAFSHILSRNTG
jgi:hypothetical protein